VTPEEAIRQAESGQLLPIYVVVGEERVLRDRVVAALREAALGGGLADFNEDKFTAGEADVDKILSAARTVPMMANRRFCLVRSVERWDTPGSASGDDKEASRASPIEKLAHYMDEPVPTTCLVLVASGLDGRRKLVSTAKKKQLIVNCDPLDDRALTAFIAKAFAGKGHKVGHDVAELLAQLAGPELGHVMDVVERLSLYVGKDGEVTEDAVAACVTRVRLADTWALVDAVSAKDLGKAMRLFADVYDPKDRGLPMLGALAYTVRLLARVATGIESGQSPDEAARTAGVPPFKAREISFKARSWRSRELERWLTVLKETDLALKSSRRPADVILEDMLTRLMRRAA
jgi:DNA polymerase-3 subunit delta